MKKYKIAVLDDYQNVALESADWSVLRDRANITVFQDHISELEPLARRLLPFDVLCIMRERTPMTAELLDRLPNLELIASAGAGNAAIDAEAVKRRGIEVFHTGYHPGRKDTRAVEERLSHVWRQVSDPYMRSDSLKTREAVLL